jgi:hypothetical protein
MSKSGSSQGVQQLLQAENDAQALIERARQGMSCFYRAFSLSTI